MPPVENSERDDRPTNAQLDRLTHVCLDESGGFTSVGDLSENLKGKAAKLPGFDYAADIDRLNQSIARVLKVRGYR